MCHRTEIQILLGLKTTGRFGSKIHFTPADTLWTIHTSQVVWVRFYSLSPRVRTKHGEERIWFLCIAQLSRKTLCTCISWDSEYEREKLIWHCKQSPAHCLNCIEKVKKWIYFCNTVHQRWNELPKNPDKMKKTQQDCSMAPWLMVQIIHHRTAGMIIFQAGFTPAAFRHTANCWATLEARTGLKSC